MLTPWELKMHEYNRPETPMDDLPTRLDTLAGRLMATTEHHQYAQTVLEAATELRKRAPEEREHICPENMLPCTDGCTGGWCGTLYGTPPQRPSTSTKGEAP